MLRVYLYWSKPRLRSRVCGKAAHVQIPHQYLDIFYLSSTLDFKRQTRESWNFSVTYQWETSKHLKWKAIFSGGEMVSWRLGSMQEYLQWKMSSRAMGSCNSPLWVVECAGNAYLVDDGCWMLCQECGWYPDVRWIDAQGPASSWKVKLAEVSWNYTTTVLLIP